MRKSGLYFVKPRGDNKQWEVARYNDRLLWWHVIGDSAAKQDGYFLNIIEDRIMDPDEKDQAGFIEYPT